METCYSFAAQTGEFMGEIEADPSPLEPGAWLYPARTTTVAPPAISPGKAAVFHDDAWSLVPDHRGEKWYAANGSTVVVGDLGDPATFDPPLIADAPPPPPPAVPASISDRQFAQVLALDGVITEDEALAWAARGDLPNRLLDALEHIPEADGQRFGARMMLSAATVYERGHPLVPTLGALLGMDAAALDAVWTRGSTL